MNPEQDMIMKKLEPLLKLEEANGQCLNYTYQMLIDFIVRFGYECFLDGKASVHES